MTVAVCFCVRSSTLLFLDDTLVGSSIFVTVILGAFGMLIPLASVSAAGESLLEHFAGEFRRRRVAHMLMFALPVTRIVGDKLIERTLL